MLIQSPLHLSQNYGVIFLWNYYANGFGWENNGEHINIEQYSLMCIIWNPVLWSINVYVSGAGRLDFSLVIFVSHSIMVYLIL